MNEYKILFCDDCKIIQKDHYNRLKLTFLTGNVYCFHKFMETKNKIKML